MPIPYSAAAIRECRSREYSDPASDVAIEVVAETGSTNADLLARIQSLTGPTLLLAERQTAGRGRAGRVWHSVPGASLTFSLAWKFFRPLQDLVGLPLAVGVALAEALATQAVRVQLKWPNDILRDGKKLGGVLIASAAAPMLDPVPKNLDKIDFNANIPAYWCVIGIGLNLAVPDQLETEVGHPVADATWLGQQDRNRLIAVILDHLLPVLRTFEHRGMALFVTRWNQYHAWQNQMVQIVDHQQILNQGRALGIDEMGRLLLETGQGVVPVLAGDVSLRKREGENVVID